MENWLGPNAFSILGAIALIRFAAWLTPGPNMLVVMNASVIGGTRAGIFTGWGVAFGGFLWASLAVGGVSALFAAFPQIALGLRLAGGAYLIWLGIKSLKGSAVNMAMSARTEQKTIADWQYFRGGFLVTATNPKAALFYGSILTAFVPVDAPRALLFTIVLMSGLIGVLTYTFTGVFFATKVIARFFDNAQRSIKASIGMLFCGLGVSIIWDALRRT